jgi:hypothetical protein
MAACPADSTAAGTAASPRNRYQTVEVKVMSGFESARSLKMANIMCTRIVILLVAAGLSVAGAAGTAFADPQPGYSDGYGYDKNGAFNDGMGYDKNGAFNDGMGYDKNGVFDDGQGYADGNGDDDNSSSSFNCFDNGRYDADGTANCGWYDGFFYPGFGNFVFDRDHHRHEMSGHQQDYFTRRARGPDGGRRVGYGGRQRSQGRMGH